VNLNVLCRHPISAVLELQIIAQKWKYKDSYLSLGFTLVGDEIFPDAFCVMCNKVLLNISMLPAKLRTYRDTNHPAYKDKNILFFFFQKQARVISKLSEPYGGKFKN
jgi:hypothetical protein